MMAYSIKWGALILILLLSQIGVLLSTDKTPDSTIHIFLSFRGADTRDNFTPLLYNGLFRAGFNVFMDEKSIRTGKDIDPSINEAIKRSMGAVIVFSRDYASSEWCLDELVLIIGQRKLRSDYILEPIYVDGVQPDDMGEKGGIYDKALAEHKKRYWFWSNKVKLWRDALRQVGGYKGKILSGKWDTFINEIVEEIRQEFSLLGITVIPRPEPSGMDPADGLPTFFKLFEDLGNIGNLIHQHQNQRLLKVVTPPSSIQQHHQSVQNKKNVELEKGSGSIWGWLGIWGFTAAFTICLSLMIFFGCWKRSKQEKESNEDLDSPRMTEKVLLTTSEQQRSAMASPSNSPIAGASQAPEESLIAGISEVLNSSMASQNKAPTRIEGKPDPLSGIQECKNQGQPSAPPLERKEEESNHSFSPDDAGLESTIIDSMNNAPKKSVIASTREAPTKIQPKPNPQNSNNTKYPPGGEAKVVLYTSFVPIYQTRFDCNEVKDILVDNGVEFEERDNSQNSKFTTELQNLMGGKLSYPRLFVMGRDIGGVEELRNLRDNGQLPNILPIQKLHSKIYSGAACHQPLLKDREDLFLCLNQG